MDSEKAITLLTYVLALGFFLLFLVVIMKMLQNKIDLSELLAESAGGGKASLSRFQLLIFTFVVAGLFLILSLEAGQILDIPNGVLGLLGISGGSYLVSKGIGKPDSPEDNSKGNKPPVDNPQVNGEQGKSPKTDDKQAIG